MIVTYEEAVAQGLLDGPMVVVPFASVETARIVGRNVLSNYQYYVVEKRKESYDGRHAC
jgi:hypothetical protein